MHGSELSHLGCERSLFGPVDGESCSCEISLKRDLGSFSRDILVVICIADGEAGVRFLRALLCIVANIKHQHMHFVYQSNDLEHVPDVPPSERLKSQVEFSDQHASCRSILLVLRLHFTDS